MICDVFQLNVLFEVLLSLRVKIYLYFNQALYNEIQFQFARQIYNSYIQFSSCVCDNICKSFHQLLR